MELLSSLMPMKINKAQRIPLKITTHSKGVRGLFRNGGLRNILGGGICTVVTGDYTFLTLFNVEETRSKLRFERKLFQEKLCDLDFGL